MAFIERAAPLIRPRTVLQRIVSMVSSSRGAPVTGVKQR